MVTHTEVTICNLALSHLGVTTTISDAGDGLIASSTDTTIEKQVCLQWYGQCRDMLLEAYPWRFARKFATLTLADDGTGEIWTDEWANAYTYPSDCLMLRRFVNDVGAGAVGWGEPSSIARHMRLNTRDYAWRYVVRFHDGAKVILTDVATGDADMEYTEAVSTVARFTPAFVLALSWCLAAHIARPLMLSADKAADAERNYYITARRAQVLSGNEDNPHEPGISGYAAARGFD